MNRFRYRKNDHDEEQAPAADRSSGSASSTENRTAVGDGEVQGRVVPRETAEEEEEEEQPQMNVLATFVSPETVLLGFRVVKGGPIEVCVRSGLYTWHCRR